MLFRSAVPTIVGINGVGGQQTTFRGFGTSIIVTPMVIDRDLIRETLRLWDQRDEGGPGLLPHLLADAAKSLRPNGSGKPPPSKRKVNAALDLANRFANPPEQTALEAR